MVISEPLVVKELGVEKVRTLFIGLNGSSGKLGVVVLDTTLRMEVAHRLIGRVPGNSWVI